jgi:hypothetical protein
MSADCVVERFFSGTPTQSVVCFPNRSKSRSWSLRQKPVFDFSENKRSAPRVVRMTRLDAGHCFMTG